MLLTKNTLLLSQVLLLGMMITGLTACGGGGSGDSINLEGSPTSSSSSSSGSSSSSSSSSSGSQSTACSGQSSAPQISSDQQIFENVNLQGGDYSLTWYLRYGGGNLIPGSNYIFSTSNGIMPASPACGPQIETPVLTTLDSNLPNPTPGPNRILLNGKVYLMPATANRQISYQGTGVKVDYLAQDGQTVLTSALFQNFSWNSLSSYMRNAPEELMAKIPLGFWISFNYLSGSAQWQPGAAYVKRQGERAVDTVYAFDCTNTSSVTYTSSTTPTPCKTGATLDNFFPVTLLNGNDPEAAYFSGDGTIVSKDGVRMWVANNPIPASVDVTQTYQVFYELNGNVYAGILQKSLTPLKYMQADGTVVDYVLTLNQAAVQSIQNGFISGSTIGSTLGSSQEINDYVDLFGIGGHGVNGALAPADLRAHYNVPATLTGSGQTIAIVDGPGTGDVADDLNVFSEYYGLPLCNSSNPCFRHVSLSNGNQVSTGIDWGIEVELDTQMVHAMAPGATILLVTAASDSFQDLATAINYAAAQPNVIAVSMSFGSNGTPTSTQQTQDSSFSGLQASNGTVFLASSGDSAFIASASYPAASPYVTGVGGTAMTSVATGAKETAWQFSGGGSSIVSSIPSWQNPYLSSTIAAGNGYKRAVPDVSAVADNQHSAFAVYYEDEWEMVGGTSVSAPLWGGVTALFAQYLNNKGENLPALVEATPGGFNGMLYESRLNGSNSAFYDVTSGSNNLTATACSICSAEVGYDNITGLGTPNVSVLFSYF